MSEFIYQLTLRNFWAGPVKKDTLYKEEEVDVALSRQPPRCGPLSRVLSWAQSNHMRCHFKMWPLGSSSYKEEEGGCSALSPAAKVRSGAGKAVPGSKQERALLQLQYSSNQCTDSPSPTSASPPQQTSASPSTSATTSINISIRNTSIDAVDVCAGLYSVHYSYKWSSNQCSNSSSLIWRGKYLKLINIELLSVKYYYNSSFKLNANQRTKLSQTFQVWRKCVSSGDWLQGSCGMFPKEIYENTD